MTSKKVLFEDDDESDCEDGFIINEDYAKKYDTWRQAEEMQGLKEELLKHSDSDSESSDEEAKYSVGLAQNRDYMKHCLLTLGAITSQNKKLMKNKFYEDEYEIKTDEDSEKPLTLQDYQRQNMLKMGDMSDGDDSEEEEEKKCSYLVKGGEVCQEEDKITFDDEDSDEDDMFIRREPQKKSDVEDTKDENNEADEAVNFIRGKIESMTSKEEEEALKALRKEYNKPDIDEKEKWLLDFFLDRNELIKQSKEPEEDCIIDEEDPSDDEETLRKMEEFETLDRFKHEKDNDKLIKTYPRLDVKSVRVKDKKRSTHRKDTEARKKKRKEERKKEIQKELKEIGKRKLASEIARIKETAGMDDIPIKEEDLENAFDPVKHDEAMKRIFSSEFYGEDSDEKPVFDDDSDIDLEEEDYDNWVVDRGESNEQPEGYEDEEHYQRNNQPGPSTSSGMDEIMASFNKKKRKQNKFSEMLSKPKPLYETYAKSFNSYVDEYYADNCLDVINGLSKPVKYKYANVHENNFGLSTNEILKATDTELNKWISWKKVMSQNRDDKQEQTDYVRYKIKGKNKFTKKGILPSLYENNGEALMTEEEKKRKKYEKKKLRKQRRLEELQSKKAKKRFGKDKKRKIESNEQKEEEIEVNNENIASTSEANQGEDENNIEDNEQKSNKKRKRKNYEENSNYNAKKFKKSKESLEKDKEKENNLQKDTEINNEDMASNSETMKAENMIEENKEVKNTKKKTKKKEEKNIQKDEKFQEQENFVNSNINCLESSQTKKKKKLIKQEKYSINSVENANNSETGDTKEKKKRKKQKNVLDLEVENQSTSENKSLKKKKKRKSKIDEEFTT